MAEMFLYPSAQPSLPQCSSNVVPITISDFINAHIGRQQIRIGFNVSMQVCNRANAFPFKVIEIIYNFSDFSDDVCPWSHEYTKFMAVSKDEIL